MMALRNRSWKQALAVTYVSLLSSVVSVSAHVDRSTSDLSHHTLTFDYVIVGAGPGGLVMANRLTEDANINVAVIEAGTWTEDVVGNLTQVPGYNLVFDQPNINLAPYAVDWGFETTPQAGFQGAVVRYQRGKCLGGSTNLNAMAWGISSAGAWDAWADEVGDASWRFDTMYNYTYKAMNFTPLIDTRRANATPEWREQDVGTGGPLDIRYPAYAYSWATWLGIALNAVGVETTDSFITGRLNGSAWQVNAINHTTSHRVSADTGYLRPYLQRPNLHIFQQTLAEKVIFDGNKTATGVLVTPNKVNSSSVDKPSYKLSASREVIVSGGVFQSPHLLQVSGVGPKDVLEAHGIPVVADRPGVGQNLQDQFWFGISYQIDVPVPVARGSSPEAIAAAQQFISNGTGPLSNSGGEYVGYEKIPEHLRGGFSNLTNATLAKLPADWPEIEYLTLPAFIGNGRTTSAAPNGSYGTIFATIQTPTSRGNVTIASASMHDAPIINPGWLTTQQDLEVSIAMFKRLREVWAVPAMRNVTIGDEFFPGNNVTSDADIENFIRGNGMPIYHASATNKMGMANDTNAVVDSSGRVFGVNKLRVVDISAFPLLIPGSAPQTGVYALSEKLADAVKKDQS